MSFSLRYAFSGPLFLGLCVFATALAPVSWAQMSLETSLAQEAKPEILRAQTLANSGEAELVVRGLVRDESGAVTAKDLRISRSVVGLPKALGGEEKSVRPISLRRANSDQSPLALAICLDESGSMRRDWQRTKEVALAAIRALREGDEVAILTCSDTAQVRLPFTTSRDVAQNLLARLEPQSRNTATLESLDALRLLFRSTKTTRRAALWLSDAQDNASTLQTSEFEALRRAEAQNWPAVWWYSPVVDTRFGNKPNATLQELGVEPYLPETIEQRLDNLRYDALTIRLEQPRGQGQIQWRVAQNGQSDTVRLEPLRQSEERQLLPAILLATTLLAGAFLLLGVSQKQKSTAKQTASNGSRLGVITPSQSLPFLVIRTGRHVQKVPLASAQSLILGRSTESDIVLVDEEVSRRHARLFFSESRWHIEDLGARNGVLLNGVRVARAPFGVGDVLFLGQTEIELRDSSRA